MVDNKIEARHMASDADMRFRNKLKRFLEANSIGYQKQWIITKVERFIQFIPI